MIYFGFGAAFCRMSLGYHHPHHRHSPRIGRLALVALVAAAALIGCGGGAVASVSPSSAGRATTSGSTAGHVVSAGPSAPPTATADATAATAADARSSSAHSYPVVHRVRAPGAAWEPAVFIRGQTAAWISQRDGVTLLRFDQSLVRLALHAGSLDPGPGPWRYGDAVLGGELHRLVAAFNGGFRLNTHSGGFRSYGRTAVALTDGLASVVTYRDGTTDIGAWHRGVPSRRHLASVRQNLRLLVNGGVAAANLKSCLQACWGATLGGRSSVARAALGITAGQMLVFAGSSSATPARLARALISGRVIRAAELDINPSWVAGYLYDHGHGPIRDIPVVPGQFGVAGHFLAPYTRDFFTIIKR